MNAVISVQRIDMPKQLRFARSCRQFDERGADADFTTARDLVADI
jgi:hypothetical protein